MLCHHIHTPRGMLPVSGFHGIVLICFVFMLGVSFYLQLFIIGLNIVRNPSGNEPHDNQFKRTHPRKPITLGETKLQEALHGTFSYFLIVFFSKAAARRHARFETVTLGKFKESVFTYFSNKRERGKVPFGFSLTFLGILPTGFRGRGPLRLGVMSFLYILILLYIYIYRYESCSCCT